MCINSIQITRRNRLTGQSKTYVVPCGKCDECRSFKRQEFAALSIHQAMVSGTLYFFTLTYRDDVLPISVFDGDRVVGFERGAAAILPSYDSPFMNRLVKVRGCRGFDFYNCASLCREDVRKWIRQFRVEYERKYKKVPSFKYCFFGELGELRGRPHYHGLFYGLDVESASWLHRLWSSRFGFAYVVPSDFHQLGLDEIGAVSNYVSKYISKGVSSRFSHLLPYIEKPRRICSLDFGSFTLDEYKRLRDYYDGADLHHLSPDLFKAEVIKRRTSYVINGQSFPIPLKIKNKIFYESICSNDGGRFALQPGQSSDKVVSPSYRKNCKTSVSCLVDKFARDKYYRDLDKQLRESAEGHSVFSPDEILRRAQYNEKASIQSREEIASKNSLTQLKHQKDAQ